MSRRTAALVAVFSAVVLVGVGLVALGGTEGAVKPIQPSSPTIAPPASPSPVVTVTEPHPDSPTEEPAAEGPPDVPTVTAGAYCDPVGARGVTKRGTPMRCTRKPGDARARWRSG